MSFQLSSPAFANHAPIPRRYTGDGEDMSPPLVWSGAPETTQCYALICEDPDAPGRTWVHWILYDLPAKTTELSEAVPQAAFVLGSARQGRNDFGVVGYGGPAPPRGKPHRYLFKLYALDQRSGLAPGVSRELLQKVTKGHVVAETQLLGTYQR